MKINIFILFKSVLFFCQCFFVLTVQAVSVQDNLSGSSSTLNWESFGGACLTAGNNSGTIPACIGLPYYSGQNQTGGFTGNLPDPVGNGALRLTTGAPYTGQVGAVVSNFTFPSNQGLQATFTTVTYQGATDPYTGRNGHRFGTQDTGGDGISFYLMDGAQTPNIGAWGGSLGYSCSNRNRPYDGVVGAYIGLGIDEFGQFLNEYDNTSTGFGYQPGRIGLRGAGNVAWQWLNANYPNYYPSSLNNMDRRAAVRETCINGTLIDYSNPANPVVTSTTIPNYAAIPGAYSVLPSNVKISNLTATTRGQATPINYQLKITQDGLLSLSFSYNGGVYQPVITNQSIMASNGPIPSTFRFAFAGGSGGSTNIHEIACFQAGPADQSTSSAALNVRQTGEVKTGSQVYLAFFSPENWTGRLTAQNLTFNAATNTVSINSAINWDASCVLTGGNCATTGINNMTAQSYSNRQILTWSGTQGIPFQWTNLTATQRSALTAGDSTVNSNRLLYLRGDRFNEIGGSGFNSYRKRTSVLADINHSSPAWVGPPSGPYTSAWKDLLYPGAAMPENTVTYSQFMTTRGTRQNVVYVGANDGFLHGFRAGGYDAGSNFVDNTTTPNDGREVIAFMPNTVLQKIHSTTATVDFSSTQYAHTYHVDSTPATGDVYYAGQWRTWLVGGLGEGGNAIYALDVTNPANFNEGNANNLVIGEWSSSTINCVNVARCGSHLGKTYGTPVIRRFHNGNWGVIFGNGFSSSSGTAGIYIMTIDSTTGVRTIRFLNTGTGGSNNGIAFVTPADLDGDHVVDYAYAGDLLGNVWRFDLTSNNPSQWRVSTFGTRGPKPLFTEPSGQPITTALMVLSSPSSTNGGFPRVLVDFGTGRKIPATITAAEQYAGGTQKMYGIWDWDLSTWNSFNTTRYATLSGTQTVTTAKLQTQTISGPFSSGGDRFRSVSSNVVCWAGSTTCSSGNTQFGWQLSLPESSEQIIFSPILSNGAIIVNTTTPPNNSPLACSSSLPTGWTMAISPTTGGSFTKSFFSDSTNNFANVNGSPVSGISLNAVGSPTVVLANKKQFLVNQTTSGVGVAKQINPPSGTKGARLNWIQLR